ncbi:hypothetical protein C8F01DRAFT_1129475, partial [Mycena amicta]
MFIVANLTAAFVFLLDLVFAARFSRWLTNGGIEALSGGWWVAGLRLVVGCGCRVCCLSISLGVCRFTGSARRLDRGEKQNL